MPWYIDTCREHLAAGSAYPFDQPHIRELAEQDFDRNDNLSTVFNHALLTGGEAWFDQLDKITVPVLVIHGTEDPVLNFGNALALVERMPGAQLLRLDGVGHELHRNDWPVIIDAIKTLA